jgi:hypothetical protein
MGQVAFLQRRKGQNDACLQGFRRSKLRLPVAGTPLELKFRMN